MAQPTGCGVAGDGTDSVCVVATLTVTQGGGSIRLDPALSYEVVHDGVDAGGGVANDTVFLGTGLTLPTGDHTPETGKYKLTPGAAVRIGPRVAKLWFVVANGGGAPTFSITANELRR